MSLFDTQYKGKKENDFIGRRLPEIGLLPDDDPQSEPGVQGFEQSVMPVNNIRSKADIFSDPGNEYDDLTQNLRFLQNTEKPEEPQRNKKLDKFVRLAQFANLIGQGVSGIQGGSVSPIDIGGGYFNNIRGLEMDYADRLDEWRRENLNIDQYNDELYNQGLIENARNIAASQGDELGYQRKKELAQMQIDAQAKQNEADRKSKEKMLGEELSYKKRYNNTISRGESNKQIQNLINSKNSTLKELNGIYVPTEEDISMNNATRQERDQALLRKRELERDLREYDEILQRLQGISEDPNAPQESLRSPGVQYTPGQGMSLPGGMSVTGGSPNSFTSVNTPTQEFTTSTYNDSEIETSIQKGGKEAINAIKKASSVNLTDEQANEILEEIQKEYYSNSDTINKQEAPVQNEFMSTASSVNENLDSIKLKFLLNSITRDQAVNQMIPYVQQMFPHYNSDQARDYAERKIK